MKKFLAKIKPQEVQLVSGIAMLGYGLFLVSPPSCYIVIGSLLISPSILPLLLALRGGKI